jgi:hypothetical protein
MALAATDEGCAAAVVGVVAAAGAVVGVVAALTGVVDAAVVAAALCVVLVDEWALADR